MALFRGIQEYIALDANNITLVFDSGNIVNISGNIFLYPPQGHPILYNYFIQKFNYAVSVLPYTFPCAGQPDLCGNKTMIISSHTSNMGTESRSNLDYFIISQFSNIKCSADKKRCYLYQLFVRYLVRYFEKLMFILYHLLYAQCYQIKF